MWMCSQLLPGSWVMVTYPKCHVCWLMIRVVMKWNWGLFTDLLAFILQLRKTPEYLSKADKGCATNHCLKWDPLPPNDVSRNMQHIREGERERRKERKERRGVCRVNDVVRGAMGWSKNSFKQAWQCHHYLFWFLTNGPECQVCQPMIRVIIKWYQGLCTDLLAFTLRLSEECPRKSQLGDHHHLKWGPLPPNYIGRIAEHVRDGEGKKEKGKDREGYPFMPCYLIEIKYTF